MLVSEPLTQLIMKNKIKNSFASLSLSILFLLLTSLIVEASSGFQVKDGKKKTDHVKGVVFSDANHNQKADKGEQGIAGVVVSDGINVTRTDASGNYQLDSDITQKLIWMTLPANHKPSGLFWHNKDGKNNIDFGLISQQQNKDLLFVQITDAHIGRADRLKQLGMTINNLPVQIDFVVETGDLVAATDVLLPDKAPEQFESALGAMKVFKQPIFHLPGNHEHVSSNVKEADMNHPNYGKGLYNQLLGPTYYSWDWADIHFLALDGTSLPYREQLGATQLEWLQKDLDLQPQGKPVILFCHQPIPSLRDSKELEKILAGRNVLGAFCGHIHKNYTLQFNDFNVFMSGAFSGTWWSGPNADGTPQGYRFIQIKNGELRTVYASTDGMTPISLKTPSATDILTGVTEFGISVVDFGKQCKVTGMYEDKPVVLRQTSRTDLWSFWEGTIDSRQAFDGGRKLKIMAVNGNETSSFEVRYLVDNNQKEPFNADASATLNIQINSDVNKALVILNGEMLGTIPAGTAKGSTITFDIPGDRLQRLNEVKLSIPENSKENCNLGPVSLIYKDKKLHDQRDPFFQRYNLNRANEISGEKTLYYVIP